LNFPPIKESEKMKKFFNLFKINGKKKYILPIFILGYFGKKYYDNHNFNKQKNLIINKEDVPTLIILGTGILLLYIKVGDQ
jgi:hypothetical protein